MKADREKRKQVDTLPPEEQLLLLSARINLDGESAKRFQNALDADLNWERVLDMAKRLGGMTLLHKHLTDPQWQRAVPGPVIQTLKDAYRKAALRSLRIQGQIQQINEEAAKRGIPIIFLKGAALSGWLYEDIALRPMSDIDLLCQKKDVKDLDRMLCDLGYSQGISPYKSQVHKTLAEDGMHLVPYSRAFSNNIEVHLSLFGNSAMEREIREHSSISFKCRNGLRVLNYEWMLLHLCQHLERHLDNSASFTLYWLSDLDELLRKYSQSLDYTKVVQVADKLGLNDTLYRMWNFMCVYMGVNLPQVVRQLDRALMSEDLHLVFNAESAKEERAKTFIKEKRNAIQTVCSEYGFAAALRYGIGILFPPKQYIKNRYSCTSNILLLGHYVIYSLGRFRNALTSAYVNLRK